MGTVFFLSFDKSFNNIFYIFFTSIVVVLSRAIGWLWNCWEMYYSSTSIVKKKT